MKKTLEKLMLDLEYALKSYRLGKLDLSEILIEVELTYKILRQEEALNNIMEFED
jgi:hypothetical protein